jgi:ESCRT-I complex subunit VPS28
VGVIIDEPAAKAQPQGSSAANATTVVTATENFITLLDAIKIGMTSREMLHPLLVETIHAVNKVSDVDFENKHKIVQWLITLNAMKITDNLREDQAKEFQFDMQQAYYGFKTILT